MAGLQAVSSFKYHFVQLILLVFLTDFQLQALETQSPSNQLGVGRDIYVKIARNDSEGHKFMRVRCTSLATNGSKRFKESGVLMNFILRGNSTQCNLTVLKSKRFIMEGSISSLVLLLDWQLYINYNGNMAGSEYSLQRNFICNSSTERFLMSAFWSCRYVGAIKDKRKSASFDLSHFTINCGTEGNADCGVVAGLSVLIRYHSTYTGNLLVSGSLSYEDFRHKAGDSKGSYLFKGYILCDQACSRGNLPFGEFSGLHQSSNLPTGLIPLGQNSSGTSTPTHSFTLDNHKWAHWLLLALIIILQFFVPIFHALISAGKGKSFRVLSLYAFVAFYAWLSFYICCATIRCSIYGRVMQDLSIFCNVMLPVCYLILLSESCVSSELLSITNTLEDISVTQYIEKLRNALPGRYCTVKCYTFGWFHKRILCFKESRLFSVQYSVDLSEDTPVDINGLTRVRLFLDVDFGDQETAEKYREFENEILHSNCHKGSHVSVAKHDFIPGFHDIVCGYSDVSQRPCWLNLSFYVLISIIGLSWPYR